LEDQDLGEKYQAGRSAGRASYSTRFKSPSQNCLSQRAKHTPRLVIAPQEDGHERGLPLISRGENEEGSKSVIASPETAIN